MDEPLVVGLILFSGLVLAGLLAWPERGFIWRWLAKERAAERVLIEDALKYLFKCERRGRLPTLESVAGMLAVPLDRATEIMDQTRQRGLVTLKGDQFQLTDTGRNIALQIVRAHRLWERYLADSTGFSEEEWHQQAEKFEHRLTVEDADRLSAQLGRPTHDPHGDPIPSRHGELVDHGGQPLTGFEEGSLVRIVHIEDEPETIYAQIVAEGIHPEMTVRIDEKSAQRVRLWSDDREYLLAPMFAANLSAIPIQEEVMERVGEGMSMDDLQVGQSGKVLDISPRIRGLDRRRLLDLGILPGTRVTAEMVSPSGDPTAYRIREAVIALREEQARLIRVLPEEEGKRIE